jgi:hypothetical protein
MQEDDYILATNLAKLRIAKSIVGDLLPVDGQITQDEIFAVNDLIYTLIERLEAKV